jgi:hypothetical protein
VSKLILDEEEYQNFICDLAFYGKATYQGMEFTVEVPPRVGLYCTICDNPVIFHDIVVLFANRRALYRTCDGNLTEDDIEIRRVDENLLCPDCEKPYWRHKTICSLQDIPTVRVLCSGQVVKL